MLAKDAERFCRTYLDAGKKSGNSWVVGDIHNTPGRSLTVCIRGATKRLGRWTDHSTGEYGDLLDLIKTRRGYTSLGPALAEARQLLGIPDTPRPSARPSQPRPQPAPEPPPAIPHSCSEDHDQSGTASAYSAQQLWEKCDPLPGTLGELYLRSRSIHHANHSSLRFNPRLRYRDGSDVTGWPAIVAALTDLSGNVLAVHRTWLDHSGRDKAPVPSPRKMLAYAKGTGIRFHAANPSAANIVVGEGIETVLSILQALPGTAGISTVSASVMPRIALPQSTGLVLIATDRDPAGYHAALQLQKRLEADHRRALLILPKNADFNDDLQALGPTGLYAHISLQLRQLSGELPNPPGRPSAHSRSREPVIALTPSPPAIHTDDYTIVPLEEIDRVNLSNAATFSSLPKPHQILSAASAYADIAKIASSRCGATKVLILTASFMAAPLERALVERGLEPLHPYIESVRTSNDDGTVSTTKRVAGIIPACSANPNSPHDDTV